MMESLPVHMSNPAVQDFLSLIRLQVLTPLSLSVNIATVLVCSSIVKPSILDIIKLYPASISPHPAWLAVYVILILLSLAYPCQGPRHKALVKAVGLSLVLANWAMAVWAIAWILRMFLFSTIMLGILFLLLVYSNVALLIYHAPTYSRPFDMALIHAPLRFFMILPLSLLFPYSLFITLGLTYASHPEDYALHPWPGFAVIIIWAASPKPAPVFITVVLFTVHHPLALISALIYDQLWHRRGRIALPPDDAPVSRRSRRDQWRGTNKFQQVLRLNADV
ncbi:hypothetical protein JVT61DRAFT_13398 [Boletus reticuloceps]|uniref:Uncharacterized protein n=1 Tax=Boletus reticuloceps TaxID=495285 RepID=A0A8I3A317_9AGAM|nr:hypothetical protein JVT61DRAFT_13398 [Boletus reticuloceps]